MSSVEAYSHYETVKVTSPCERVLRVELNRPKKRNAMNAKWWREFRECFQQINLDNDVLAVVVTGAGKMFTGGLDVKEAAAFVTDEGDVARKALNLRHTIEAYQETMTSIEKCKVPVIAAVHNGCIGGGVDLITACDIRLCSADATFVVKEIDVGLAADVGTLQRLPKVIGNQSLVRELCYTGRPLAAAEALSAGLVSSVHADRDATIAAAVKMAQFISTKSPVALIGTKKNIIYSRDHTVAEGLDYMVAWNAACLQTDDMVQAITASMMKTTPVFAKL